MREVKWEAAWWWIAETMQIFQRDILEPLCADMRGGVYGGRSGNLTIAALYGLYDQAGGFRSVVESLPYISQEMAERMSAEEMGGLLALSQQIDEAYGLGVGIPSGEISISGKLSDRWVREAGGRWKIGKAVELAWPRLLPEVVKEFGDPLAMAAMLAVAMGAAVAVAAAGGGLLAEAALLGVGLLAAGKGLSDGIVRMVEFFKLVEKAKTVEELWEAADAFADAMAKLAVNGLFLLLSVLGVKKMNSKINAGDYLAKQVKLNNYKSAKQLYQQEILNKKPAEIIKPTTEIRNHIKYVDPTGSRKNGITGGHNSVEFFKNDIKIISRRPHPQVKGVEIIEYHIRAKDKTGSLIHGEYQSGMPKTKTVYDPLIMSDETYITRGIEAANNALSKSTNGILSTAWEGTDSFGIPWIGFYRNGKITSFFPK